MIFRTRGIIHFYSYFKFCHYSMSMSYYVSVIKIVLNNFGTLERGNKKRHIPERRKNYIIHVLLYYRLIVIPINYFYLNFEIIMKSKITFLYGISQYF